MDGEEPEPTEPRPEPTEPIPAEPLPEPSEPLPTSNQACRDGCEDSECATPGTCSLASACALADCGGLSVDESACIRPRCDGDDDCPVDQRCTALTIARRSACSESAGACRCTLGLDLLPLRLCTPVELAGPRGRFSRIVVQKQNLGADSLWTIYPDAHIERVGPGEERATAQLSNVDRDLITDMVEGTALRTALVDPIPCADNVVDLYVMVGLVLDDRSFEKDVTGCVVDKQRTTAFPMLFELANRY
jgi:hypothetical protein